MDDEKSMVPDYLMGQGITYFFLSLLLMLGSTTVANNYVDDKPTFYIDHSQLIPMPVINLHINFGYWLMIILAFSFLTLSIFFLVSLIPGKWNNLLKRIARSISPFVNFLVFLSFVISWLGGLGQLLGSIENVVIAGILIYSGFFMFLVMLILTIKNFIHYFSK